MDKRDEDWLKEIDKLLIEITNLPIEKMNNNTRRNNMRKQLLILKARMGYSQSD